MSTENVPLMGAARVLGMGRTRAYEYARQGKFSFLVPLPDDAGTALQELQIRRVGRRWVVSLQELTDFLGMR